MSARRRSPVGAMDESLLSAYLDGELEARERAEVEARLAESHDLRAVLDEVRGARDAVRGLGPIDAPDTFWERVLRDDSAVVDLDAARATRRSRTRRWSALAGAAAAAIVVGVAVVPRPAQVHPPIAALTRAHAERASESNDPITNLAGVPVAEGEGR